MVEKKYRNLKKELKEKNYEKFMEEDIEFHKYLLNIYENKKFIEIIANLYDRVMLLGVIGSYTGNRAKQAILEHEKMINFIEEKNKKEFVKSIEDNILNGYRNLMENYKI